MKKHSDDEIHYDLITQHKDFVVDMVSEILTKIDEEVNNHIEVSVRDSNDDAASMGVMHAVHDQTLLAFRRAEVAMNKMKEMMDSEEQIEIETFMQNSVDMLSEVCTAAANCFQIADRYSYMIGVNLKMTGEEPVMVRHTDPIPEDDEHSIVMSGRAADAIDSLERSLKKHLLINTNDEGVKH